MIDPYGPIGALFPRSIRKKVRTAIGYSYFDMDPEKFLGFAILFGLGIGFVLAFFIDYYDVLSIGVAFVICVALVEFILYIWLVMSADSKARFVDEALPDALQLMSSNIRGGLTTDKALLMSARPEFGPLEEEIKRIGKETMAGKDLADSLEKTTDKIKSKNLQRAMDLIVQSLKSGGQLADLLDQTANDLREQQMIQKEISASVLMYVIFIVIAIALGAPALFAMSSFLVTLLTKNMAMIASDLPTNMADMGGAMPISIREMTITPEFIRTYSLISLSMSSFFGSLIMGLILKGEEKAGLKFFPLILSIALGLFLLARYVLDLTLGSMMGF